MQQLCVQMPARTQCDAEETVGQHADGCNQQHDRRKRVVVAYAQRPEHLRDSRSCRVQSLLASSDGISHTA